MRGCEKSNVDDPEDVELRERVGPADLAVADVSFWKTVRSSASAIASDASASASTPSRRTGIAISAPIAAGDEGAHDRGHDEVDLAVARDEREVDPPVVVHAPSRP